ncbi:MAG: cytochrome c biogenesis CcdA family protein [Filifactoraceae bacterium]
MDIMGSFLEFMTNNLSMALPLAFIAGLLSSFSPCILSTLPLVIGYIGNSDVQDKKRGLLYSLTFVIGLTITFVIMGITTAILGQLLASYTKYIYILISIILLVSGLNLLGVLTLGKRHDTCAINHKDNKKGLIGIFFLGMFGGVVSTPCATPVLAAILGFVATNGSIFYGTMMLIFYSFGHGVLIILAGLSMSTVNQILQNPDNQKKGIILKYVFGVLVILAGLYIFSLGV